MTIPLTKIPGVPDRQHDVRPGMAFFTRTGPPGTTCGMCKMRGFYRRTMQRNRDGEKEERYIKTNACAVFLTLTGKPGPVVRKDWASCKYFEKRKDE